MIALQARPRNDVWPNMYLLALPFHRHVQKWTVSMTVSSSEGCELRYIDRYDFAQKAIHEPLLLIVRPSRARAIFII